MEVLMTCWFLKTKSEVKLIWCDSIKFNPLTVLEHIKPRMSVYQTAICDNSIAVLWSQQHGVCEQKNTHGNPKIRCDLFQIQINFLSNGMCCIYYTPHILISANLYHLLPGKKNSRIRNDAVDYHHTLLIGRGWMSMEVRFEFLDDFGVSCRKV